MRISCRISVASGQLGPWHSISTSLRSSSPVGHLDRCRTRPPSTRNTTVPRKLTRCPGRYVISNPAGRFAVSLAEMPGELVAPLPGINVICIAGDLPDHDRRWHVVILQGRCLASGEGTQQCDKRAERLAYLPKSLTGDFDCGVRKTGLAQCHRTRRLAPQGGRSGALFAGGEYLPHTRLQAHVRAAQRHLWLCE